MENNLIYEKNKKFLNKDLVKIIENTIISDNLKVEETKNSDITVRYVDENFKIYIHSKYNPNEEAENAFGKKEYKKGNIFIAGFGLGYHINVIRNKINFNQKIYVWICNIDLFKLALLYRDLTNIFSDERIEFIFGTNKIEVAQKIKEILNVKGIENWDFIVHSPSLKIINSELKELGDIIETIEINKNSLKLFKPIIFRNIVNNIENFIFDCGINKFKDFYKDKNFYIVSAGPSLDKNINYLSKVQSKGVIICVGTVAKKLIQNNIIPNFIIAIDGLENIKKQLEGIKINIPLIYFPTINSEALLNYNGEKIVAFPKNDSFFEEINKIYDKGFIDSGGSVATAACDCSVFMGAKRIIFVGQDLAISEDGYTHAKQTQFENTKKEYTGGLKKVKGNYTPYVYTTNNLYVYLRWFENYIKENKKIEFINATEGGAFIEGTKLIRLSEIVDINDEEIDFNKIIEIIKIEKEKNIKQYNIDVEKNKIIKILNERE